MIGERRASCGDESGNGLSGEGVEVERRLFAALEMKQSGARDHRRVVGREARRRREDLDPARLESFPHRGDERRVARDAAAEHDARAAELPRGAGGLLDERVDQRVLKRARDRAAVRRRGSTPSPR